jgi:hypothetical protein
MYSYIYTHIRICIYVHVHTYLKSYVDIHIHVYMCRAMYVNIYLCIYIINHWNRLDSNNINIGNTTSIYDITIQQYSSQP